MTREEAINELKYAKSMCEFDPITGELGCRNDEDKRQSEAFGIAIKALENENAVFDKALEIIEAAHFDLDDSALERDVYMRVSEFRKCMKKAVMDLKGGD